MKISRTRNVKSRICKSTFLNHVSMWIAIIGIFTVTGGFTNDLPMIEPWPANVSKYRLNLVRHDSIDSIRPLLIDKKVLTRAIISEGNPTRLQTVFAKAKMGGKLVIGVIGGSITEGSAASSQDKNYANVVLEWWKKTFPKTKFELVNAGIGATGSNFGAMRVKRDLLSKSPDIVVIEYAVNDVNSEQSAEFYEGVVRQILHASQNTAVMLLFMTDKNGASAQEWQSKIGTHYNLPMISYRDAVWPEIKAGRLNWEQVTADEVHPNDAGHLLAGELIGDALEEALKKSAPRNIPGQSEMIPAPLISDLFEFTSLLDGKTLIPLNNRDWVFDTSVNTAGAGWKCSIPGSVLEFEISGKEIYLSFWTIKGPMGKVGASIDGGSPVIIDSWFDQTWGGYIKFIQIGSNLSNGKHLVRLELLSEKNPNSTGNDFKVICLSAAGIVGK